MKLMHLLYLTGVCCLFLCHAVDANVTDCQPRNLTGTGDDAMRLYIDGVEISAFRYGRNWRIPRSVELPCNATLIAIEGTNVVGEGGILASTDDGYIVTNSSWKCTNRSFTDWQTTDFDDSDWPPAFEALKHGNILYGPVPGIRENTTWIWTTAYKYEDLLIYCRKTLDVNECIRGPPENECDPSMGKCSNFYGSYRCICYEGYVNSGSKRCKDINECLLGPPDNECDPSMGKCINFIGNYNCSCYEGYVNSGNKICGQEVNFAVSTCKDSTSLLIIGVFFGVSVLVNIALLSALLIHHSGNKTTKDEGQSGVGTNIHDNGIALHGERNVSKHAPTTGEVYDHLNSETTGHGQLHDYEQLQIE